MHFLLLLLTVLISIFDFGKHGFGILWIVYLLLSLWLLFQTYRTHSKIVQKKVPFPLPGAPNNVKWIDTPDHTPVTRIPTFWFFIAITVIAIVIHILITADYK
jgi:ABC-type glycerol-3-phosphate transport system permease component